MAGTIRIRLRSSAVTSLVTTDIRQFEWWPAHNFSCQ